jgi:hypothetical protein
MERERDYMRRQTGIPEAEDGTLNYSTSTPTFAKGDQVSYVNVHGLRVWWLRDAEGRWWPSDYATRQSTGTDTDTRDLLYAAEHQGRDDIEWKPADDAIKALEQQYPAADYDQATQDAATAQMIANWKQAPPGNAELMDRARPGECRDASCSCQGDPVEHERLRHFAPARQSANPPGRSS